MDIYCVAEIVGQAYPTAFTTSNITRGFRKSGIYLLDRNVFNDLDFLQSYVTDRPASIDPGSNISPTALPGPSTSSDAVDARPIVFNKRASSTFSKGSSKVGDC